MNARVAGARPFRPEPGARARLPREIERLELSMISRVVRIAGAVFVLIGGRHRPTSPGVEESRRLEPVVLVALVETRFGSIV